jgi:thioredoxin reductase
MMDLEQARRRSVVDQEIVRDLIVVGAGPAGLAAAVYAASEGLSNYAGRKRDTESRPDGWKDKAVRNAAIVTGALMKKLATI